MAGENQRSNTMEDLEDGELSGSNSESEMGMGSNADGRDKVV